MSSAMVPPEIRPFHFSGNMAIGERAGVMCVVIRGDSPFSFTWLKDNVEIKDVPGISIASVNEYTSALSISKLTAHSNGNYTCRVSNSAGSDAKFDSILVKGKVMLLYECIYLYLPGFVLYIFFPYYISAYFVLYVLRLSWGLCLFEVKLIVVLYCMYVIVLW